MARWRVNLPLANTRSSRNILGFFCLLCLERFLLWFVEQIILHAEKESEWVIESLRLRMRENQFRAVPIFFFLLFFFVFNGCDALYGPSSPVLQLTPTNFKSKVKFSIFRNILAYPFPSSSFFAFFVFQFVVFLIEFGFHFRSNPVLTELLVRTLDPVYKL